MDWPKQPISWIKNRTFYISIPFTWNLPDVRKELTQRSLFWDRVIVGGPAVYLMPNFFTDMDYVSVGYEMPGILQRVNPMATRTTRGCVRNCGFCGVREIEGEFREFFDWPGLPIICDNNLLAASQPHFDRVIDRLKPWGWADFNQGLDCRLLTQYHADRIAEIRKPIVRLALDDMRQTEEWEIAFSKLRKAGIAKKNIRSYALIGFNSDHGEAWQRCEWIEGHKILALPMWFHPLDALKKNQVTREQEKLGWSDYERRRIMQWFYQHKKAVKKEPG